MAAHLQLHSPSPEIFPRPIAKGEREKEKKRVLVVDDEPSARVGLAELIESWGFESETAEDGRSALDKLRAFHPHVVVCDLVMPRMDGLAFLKSARSDETIVILLTAQGTIDSAVEAIKEGAYDYLTKPVDIVRLKNLLERLNEKFETEDELKRLRRELRQLGSFGQLIGTTPAMQELFHQIELTAPSTASVLISGASGTGKELVARAIHQMSPRRHAPFVPINCSAIPGTLLETEIFGHEKGAFTGAIKTTEGCFELAHGGTILLDEIAAMAMDLQSKLLRVLENGTFRRVGGREELHANVRVVAASNIHFEDAIAQGMFREDLYYRLNVFHLELPALKDRAGDIPLLAQNFLDEYAAKNERPVRSIHPEAIQLLKNYSWPGNVRELRNIMERAVIICRGKTITVEELPESVRQRQGSGPSMTFHLGTSIGEVERQLILNTLNMTGGNKTETARILGISLKTLHNKLNRYRRREHAATRLPKRA
ncbi:MAG TPA: sigma-54 dependent transcriptional regulator [Bdellovibrionota bacterium]|nr:sigma-54 dependent transcriptional regulator [Bdellovibrionota bacterium]